MHGTSLGGLESRFGNCFPNTHKRTAAHKTVGFQFPTRSTVGSIVFCDPAEPWRQVRHVILDGAFLLLLLLLFIDYLLPLLHEGVHKVTPVGICLLEVTPHPHAR